MNFLINLTTILLAGSLLPLSRQAPRDGDHDFDFEIGNWKTHISRLERPLSGSTRWIEYEGTSVVRKVWDGRANTVELEVDGPDGQHIQGLSLRLYNPRAKQWSLNFVSSASGILSVPTVGRFENGRGEFYDWEEYDGRMILVRNVWKDITPTSCRFEQSFSDDGGKTWELNWVATDTRIANPPAPTTNDAPHDFDFEAGSWTVKNSRLLHPLTDSARWIHFDGTSEARKLWNGRGVLIELESEPPSGHAEGLILRTWNPATREWNVSFAGSASGVLSAPEIGGFKDGRAAFYSIQRMEDGRTVLGRSVLSGITPASYRLEQAMSADGGKTWTTTWISEHTRTRSGSAGHGAQGNPVSDAVRASAADYGKNLLASARLMPEEKFGYKPTPAQMTFGELLVHIHGDNRTTCAAIGRRAPSAEKALAVKRGKDALVAALERSLEFCDQALAGVTDGTLGDSVPYYRRRAPRAVAMVGLVTDWANHYNQQAIYLRLNGILPPTAKK